MAETLGDCEDNNTSNAQLIGAVNYMIVKEVYKNKSIIDLWIELERTNLHIYQFLEEDPSTDLEMFYDSIAESLVISDLIKAKSNREKSFLIKKLEQWKQRSYIYEDFKAATEYRSQLEYFIKNYY